MLFSCGRLVRASFLCLPLLSSLPFPAVAGVSTAPDIQVGFSPEGTGRLLVLNTIGSAQQSIRMMAYSFTDPDVMKALIAAHQRGVDVKIVIDEKGNRNRASMAAMNLIVNAGIPLRTNDRFPIQHDKILIVDNHTVESGSYNFSRAADRSNSENVLVVWDDPALARRYLNHWTSRWAQGTDWKQTY
nr:phospholipase D family protein [Raoultella terrigena]